MQITELGALRAKCGIAQQGEFRVQAWTVDAGDGGDIDIENKCCQEFGRVQVDGLIVESVRWQLI